jgi:hypothetical protein
MKKQALTLAGALILLLAAGSAFAQTIHVRGSIPFDFIVDKETLPAGQYTIDSIGLMSDGRTVAVRDADAKPKAMINANSVQSSKPSAKTKLVFVRYGDRYFLSQVWLAGSTWGHQFPKSPREAEVAMNYNPQQAVVLAELH